MPTKKQSQKLRKPGEPRRPMAAAPLQTGINSDASSVKSGDEAPSSISSEPRINRTQQKDVERRSPPSATIVYETIRREGVEELNRSNPALFWSGLAAGLSMGFSFVAEALLQSHLPSATWTPLITKFGYAVGFLIVILGRQQLFTENTLTPILELLRSRSGETLKQLFRLWGVVLSANLVGAVIFACILAFTNAFEAEMHTHFRDIGLKLIHENFSTAFVRAIFAGWLIALMVWLLPFAETWRVAVIIIITYVIGIGAFGHIIAGTVETIYLVFVGAVSFPTFFMGFFLPVLLGNTVGGITLVAALKHAQVMSEGGKR